MKRPRILPLGTPDEPRRPDRLQPQAPRTGWHLSDLACLAAAVCFLAAAVLFATDGWRW